MMCGTFVGKVESWDASRQMREYKGSKMEAKGGGREAYLRFASHLLALPQSMYRHRVTHLVNENLPLTWILNVSSTCLGSR